jgi:protein-tyrosine kinase
MESPENEIAQVLSELAEANRILAGIESLVSRKTPLCWMITSAARGEGKTTLTAGLGMLAARRGDKRVLAIDMNWYSPGLHKSFGLTPDWDLNLFSQNSNLIELIRPTGVANLDLLTAPVTNRNREGSCMEYADVAKCILKQAKDTYDFILVDTAAVFPANRRMTDPVVLGSVSDSAIMVVLKGITSRQQIRRAQVMLENAGTRLAGVVVNLWKNNV